jgi:hypothetical protein
MLVQLVKNAKFYLANAVPVQPVALENAFRLECRNQVNSHEQIVCL